MGGRKGGGEVRLVDFFSLAVFAMLVGTVSEGWIMYT